MSKKSRRQRQRAKKRNYAELNNPTRDDSPAPPDQPQKQTTASRANSTTPAVPRSFEKQNTDLWDALIFSGAIFVAFIAIYYINQHTPILETFGNRISSFFGVSF